MKKVPSHGYVRITGPAAGRPADRLFPDRSPIIRLLDPPPFLIGEAIIDQFSDKEWASEGAYGGDVDENGCFS